MSIGEVVEFEIHVSIFDRRQATCSLIMDAGDDSYITYGAEIERVKMAISLVREGQRVALVSSGDSSVYDTARASRRNALRAT